MKTGEFGVPGRPRCVPVLILPLLAALGLLGCTTGESTRETYARSQTTSAVALMNPAPGDTSYIMIGDSVIVSVWGYPEFTTHAAVKATGTITVPLVGEQLAAGLRKDELIARLRQKLAEYIKGEIRIGLDIERSPPRITVLGTVARPGSFPATTDVTLLEVLANVGGWNEEADLRYVRINRQSSTLSDPGALVVNLAWYMDRGNTRSVPMVRPGDVVIVPRKENFVRDVSDFLRDAFILFGVFRLAQ